ncbi:MAG: patatin-like phospholipase family protein [Anaerolineae bacterium]|nr:patatin-like phospholipase family protein [Anaerolineae bacterium]
MMQAKIGLVLGGGGVRGLAHIGVLQVLEREQIPVDFIVATSMGGIVGVLWALGNTPAAIATGLQRALVLNNPDTGPFNTVKQVKLVSSRARQQRMRQQLQDAIGDRTFADLQRPVSLMAVDMVLGDEVVLSEGALVPALLATSAVPGVFPPVVVDNRQLADGAVIDSLATHVAYAQGATHVIAVDVQPALETEHVWVDPIADVTGIQWGAWFGRISGDEPKQPGVLQSLWRSSRIMAWHIHQLRLRQHLPDIMMRPSVDAIGTLDLNDTARPIEAGIVEAERHLDALRALKMERHSI